MRIIQFILCAAILGLGFSIAHGAVEPVKKVDCDAMGANSVNNMELNDDGSIKKITASGQASLDFPDDPEELEEARQVAEMEAKAAIAHFMKEEIKSEKSIEKITSKMKEQTRAGKKMSGKKVNKKTMSLQIRKIHNSANSLLKGVVALEECYDRERELIRVQVGVSTATMEAADSLRQAAHKDALTGSSSEASGAGAGGAGAGGAGAGAEEGVEGEESPAKKMDSFRRKSKMKF